MALKPATKKIITYAGGFWSTNIGNSFFDLGTIHLLKEACPSFRVVFCDEQPGNHWRESGENPKNSLSYLKYLNSEYIVISGSLLTKNFPKLWGPTFENLFKKGVKLLLISVGCSAYNKEEIDICRKFLAKYPPHILISRDEYTYDHFKDLAKYSYNGIDCAFYVSNIFQSFKTDLDNYIVLNFDGTVHLPLISKLVAFAGIENEPTFKRGNIDKRYDFNFEFLGKEWNINYNLRSFNFKNLLKGSSAKSPEYINNFRIIRTKHSTDSMSRKEAFSKTNMFVSDIPYTYLNIYSNAKATFSNRVHACVATLAFGNHAMLFSKTSRAHLFERFDELSGIKKKPVSISKHVLESEKIKQLAFLKGALND